jgi:cysteinyl-tRNA synthetase
MMPPIRLYNTLSRRKEVFEPVEPGVARMYCCGPTVYNYAHIGNLRTYLFEDLLHRLLVRHGLDVRHVMNITDVGHMTSDADAGEDKMMKAAHRESKSPWEIAKFYEEAFEHDLARLNIVHPTVTSRATEHISYMIDLIVRLEERGYTYRTAEGIYFDTAKDEDYGKLADLNIAGQREGAREEVNVDPQKKHASDFILWFTNKPGHIMEWDSPWGRGYPGWHIECSAMSMHYLGESFDIHCGGIDHIPVHNTNEIAQSESATGCPFVRYWVHGAFLNVKGSSGPGHAKMAKSGENFLTVDRLVERGYDPIVYRYFTLNAHYRSELMFSWEALEGARRSLARIYTLAAADEPDGLDEQAFEKAAAQVEEALADDLNAPRAVGILHEFGSARLWRRFEPVLGLQIDEHVAEARRRLPPPESVAKLLKKRETARLAGSWDEADKLREKIEKEGYVVGDGPDGSKLSPRLP